MNSIHVKHKDVSYFIKGINPSTHDKLMSLAAVATFGKAISLIYPFVPDEDHDEDLDCKIVDLHLGQAEFEQLEILTYDC